MIAAGGTCDLRGSDPLPLAHGVLIKTHPTQTVTLKSDASFPRDESRVSRESVPWRKGIVVRRGFDVVSVPIDPHFP